MRFSGLLIFILCWTANLYSQTENEVVNDYLERYIENSTDEIDIQQFASDLLYYFDHPLDLNKASATELFEVPFLTGFQSMEIIEHRKTYGDFIELYELQILPSFTLSDIEHLLPFVSLKANSLSSLSLKKIWNQGQHQILSLAETITPNARGFIIADTASVTSSNQYLGSPIYSNLRYRFDFKKHISLGFNAEKDAGEPIFNSEYNRGFDYYSFYFSARDINRIKSLNIGDYQANFGQGLTLSTGLAFGKSSIITNSKRNFNGFGAYRSLRENAYLRGGALSFQLKKIDIGVFTSFKKVDGNAVTSNESSTEDISETNYFTNIQEDGGYHRTLSEFEDKRVVRDMQVGVYGEIKLERGKIGMVSYARKLNSPINPTPQAYNQFSFRGDQYSKTGLYYDYVFRNVNLFGEISHSSFKNSIAQVHGALLSLNKSFDLSLVYRNYDKSFITYQTNGFGENSSSSNENGIYTGFQAKVNRKITILGYYDLFKSPWLKFQAIAPSFGKDFWIEGQYKPNKVFKVYYRFRSETKLASNSLFDQKILTEETISRHRVHLSNTISKGVELRSRVELSTFDDGDQKSLGSLIYQDVVYKPFGIKYQLSGRVAYSTIDRYENRIYSFEQTPLYDYPLFTHGFSGLRWYILARFKPSRTLDIWFKYGHTQHYIPLNSLENNYSIGSGLNNIAGNLKRTFTLQIRYKIK